MASPKIYQVANLQTQLTSVSDAANNRVLKSGDTITGQLNVKTTFVSVSSNSTAYNGMFIASSDSVGAGIGGVLSLGGKSNSTNDTRFAAVAGLKLNSKNNEDDGYLAFYTRKNGLNLAEWMRIGSDGYVGIATTSPAANLDVNGTARISSNLTVDSGTFFVDAVDNEVGIGTTTPNTKLHVNGTSGAMFIGSTPTNQNPLDSALEIRRPENQSSHRNIKITGDYVLSAPSYTGNRNSYINYYAYVAGGESPWPMYLDIAALPASSSDFTFGGNGSFIRFLTAAGTGNTANVAMVVDPSGNVGIGTTTPTANLHVTGTIKDTPIVTITGNETYSDNAAGRVIVANTTSAVTVTIAAGATAGFSYTIIRGNTGNVTIANSGVTRLNSASITTMNVTQYGAATVVYTATNQVIVFGDFVG